jgi:hypothetical protein
VAALLGAPLAGRELELRHVAVELPAAPATVLFADLDGDGRRDLVTFLAWAQWGQLGVEGEPSFDPVNGLVETMTIVPALQDRREVRAYLARDGGFSEIEPLPVDASVLGLETDSRGGTLVALTDSGASLLELEPGGERPRLVLRPWIEEPTVLAGTGTFVPGLGLLHDLDGDRRADLLLPQAAGLSVYLGGSEGLARSPAGQVEYPADPGESGALRRSYPLPQVEDVDGDRLPDLLLRLGDGGWDRLHVARNLGGGRFAAPAAPAGTAAVGEAELVHFGDLDGDGVAEYATAEELPQAGDSMRQELEHAKRPPHRYRFHRSAAASARAGEPYAEFVAPGWALGAGDDDGGVRIGGGLQDLDGDGRQDLVTVTLDFSLAQAVKILATKRIGLGLDFHVWCQRGDGSFREVRGLDLSGRFSLDLDDLRLGNLAQFAGDFDGDGRRDFLQIGRGRSATVHRGQAGCSYPARPDLVLELREAPLDLALVQVRDLDGDGRADLLIVQPRARRATGDGAALPVRLDLYLSGGAP